MSVYHFHRVFTQAIGLTPKQYAAAQREKRLRNKLDCKGTGSCGDTVTHVIFDAGYNSNSRFYEKSSKVLGMTPSRYRAGGINTEIRFAVGECSLGSILVARSDRGICAIMLGDDPGKLARALQDKFPHASLIGGDADFEQLAIKSPLLKRPRIWSPGNAKGAGDHDRERHPPRPGPPAIAGAPEYHPCTA